MRIEKLKHTVLGVVLLILIAGAGTAYIRTYIFESGHEAHEHGMEAAKGPQSGEDLFRNKCSDCHYIDSRETLIGPGLKGLFLREKLPVSGREVTKANLLNQLNDPYKNMPSFKDLTESQKDRIIKYIKTF